MQEGQVVFGLLLFISEPIPNGIRILVKNGEKNGKLWLFAVLQKSTVFDHRCGAF